MSINRKALSAFIVFSIVVFALFLVPFKTTLPKEKIKVTVAVSTTPLSAPFYVAQTKGFFQKEGVEADLQPIAGGKKAFHTLMNNRVDMATSSESVVVFGSFLHDNFKVLSSFVTSDNDIKIVSRTSSAISSPTDLLGKKVGVIKGSASEYFLHLLLSSSNISSQQLSTVAMKPDEMKAALEQGTVDAVSVWEPYAYQMQTALSDQVSILSAKGLYQLSFNLLAKPDRSDTAIERNKRVLKALLLATQYIANHPEETKEIIAKELSTNRQFLDWIWQDYLFKLSLNSSLISTMDSQARWAIKEGLVDHNKAKDLRSYIDSKALNEISPLASVL